MTRISDTSAVELAARRADRVDVRLLWRRSSGEVTVRVYDERCDAGFELDVSASRALDVFHHPFAYAARRGIPYPLPSDGPLASAA